MFAKATLAVLFATMIGQSMAQTATPVTDNPVGVVYKATLPDKPFFTDAAITGPLKGSIAAIAPIDRNGVKFTVKFENLPAEGGPFTYHLHVNAALNGNCTATLGHLDPFGRGSTPPCDASKPESCEVGDLSGKHGKVDADPFSTQYIDYYASTKEGNAAFFGNTAFVLHYANGTRLACGNFEKVADPIPSEYPSSNCTLGSVPSNTGGVTPVPTPTPTGPAEGVGSTDKLAVFMGMFVALAIWFGLA